MDAVRRQMYRSLRTVQNPVPVSRCASTKLCRRYVCANECVRYHTDNSNALFYRSAMCELPVAWGEHSTNRKTQAGSQDCDLCCNSRKLPRERVTLLSHTSCLPTRCNDNVCAVCIETVVMRSSIELRLSADRYTKLQQMSQAVHIEQSGSAEKSNLECVLENSRK
jgi:hypothetical protein